MGDLIYGGNDEDTVLGDNGQILRIRVGQDSDYPWILGSIWKTYPEPFSHSVIRNVSRYDDIDYVGVSVLLLEVVFPPTPRALTNLNFRQGDDEIHGGAGNDVLHGQRGNDGKFALCLY